MGQEIKNRKNPQKTGKIRKNPQKTAKIRKIRKNPQKSGNPKKKSSQKIFHFLKDFHSLTPAAVLFPLEQSLILFNKSRSQALCSQCLTVRPRG